jgi:ATP-dependent helicase HrpA
MLPEKVAILLKGLPKGIRKYLVPFNETARRIFLGLEYGKGDFYSRLSEAVFNLTGVSIPVEQWNVDQLPDHLKMRFEVVGPQGNVLASGRDIATLRPLALAKHEDTLWREARKIWELDAVEGFDFGDLPRSIEIGTDAMGIPRLAYPGLADEEGRVAVRLFAEPGSARESTRPGLMRLYKKAFSAELGGFRKDWALPDSYGKMVFFMGGIKEASSALYDYILRCLFGLESAQYPDRNRFLANVEKLRGRLGTLGAEIRTPVLEVLLQKHEARTAVDRFIRMAGANQAVLERMGVIIAEIETLVPPDFLSRTPDRLMRLLPRYLRTARIRAERAYASPEKDRAKEARINVYRLELDELGKRVFSRPTQEGLDLMEEVARMIEELKISLFAPEIKTLFPISGKRIEKKLQGLPA